MCPLLLCSMIHYDITMGNDVARDAHYNITMGNDVARTTVIVPTNYSNIIFVHALP